MPISKDQRSNLKKFRRSDNTAYVLKEINLNFVELDKAIKSNDEKVFFSIYDQLVDKGLIHDVKHREKLHLNSIQKAMERQVVKTLPTAPPAPKTTARDITTLPAPVKAPKANKVRYNLLIDEDILERLKDEAIKADRSVSSLIRISVTTYLNNKGQ